MADLYQIDIIEKTRFVRNEAYLLTMPVGHHNCKLYALLIKEISVYSRKCKNRSRKQLLSFGDEVKEIKLGSGVESLDDNSGDQFAL